MIARPFDAGAADYVVKPFSPTELTARIRAALRKQTAMGPDQPTDPYVLGGLAIDYTGRGVTVAGQRVRLTDIEYRLLVELSIHAGQVVTYDHLLRKGLLRGGGESRLDAANSHAIRVRRRSLEGAGGL